ncbi:MAG: (d)CMP kinase [Alphaproteobacteria bacterium]|nr:(d)CMP kinase [Alphaproteobacteria bacterium]
MSNDFIIAIDGPSASGKGTIARKLADHFRLPYLDTGLLYRWVALSLKSQNKAADDIDAARNAAIHLRQNIITISFDDPELRGHAISQPSSMVAAMPEVRRELVELQQSFANQAGGAVLDGRDIGTVIAPHAKIKLFITASAEKRAERRFKELQNKGQTTTYDAVLTDLQARDARDETRTTAPSKIAVDAVKLDTSDLNVDEAFAAALKIVNSFR